MLDVLLHTITCCATEEGGDLNGFLKNTTVANHGVTGHQDSRLTGPPPSITTAIAEPSGYDHHSKLSDAEETVLQFFKWLNITEGDQLDPLIREALKQGKPQYHYHEGTRLGDEQTSKDTGRLSPTQMSSTRYTPISAR
jgi:hypothetical protein